MTDNRLATAADTIATFVAGKGGRDCDDECYFDLPRRS